MQISPNVNLSCYTINSLNCVIHIFSSGRLMGKWFVRLAYNVPTLAVEGGFRITELSTHHKSL